jgi:hypothetical protein
VRTFLLGLKTDLAADNKRLEGKIKLLQENNKSYAWLAQLDPSVAPDPQQFAAAADKIGYPVFGVIVQRGRYESFKSAGRLGNIENAQLLQRLVEVYEEGHEAARIGEQFSETNRRELKAYVDEGTDARGMDARFSLLTAAKGKRLLGVMGWTALSDYEGQLRLQKELLALIDAAYPATAN